MMEISEFFSTSFQTSLIQDPMVTCVQNFFFSKNLALVLKWQFWSVFGENIVKELKGLMQQKLVSPIPRPAIFLSQSSKLAK